MVLFPPRVALSVWDGWSSGAILPARRLAEELTQEGWRRQNPDSWRCRAADELAALETTYLVDSLSAEMIFFLCRLSHSE